MLRAFRVLITAAVALTVATAQAAAPVLGPDAARHLLFRTSFTATPAEVDQYARLTRGEFIAVGGVWFGAEPGTPVKRVDVDIFEVLPPKR